MYNPSDHKVQNIPFSVGGIPLNAKSLYYDKVKFIYRPYISVEECLSYIGTTYRTSDFSVVINTGGTISPTTGKLIGGVNSEWWWKDGVSDDDLIQKEDPTKIPLDQKDAVDGIPIISDVALKTTIDGIRALSGVLKSNLYYSTDLGKEGNWYYDSLDTTSADNTGTILVSSDGKRFKRDYFGGVNAQWFGADKLGVVESSTFAQLALNYLISIGGGVLFFPLGKYLFNGTAYVNPTLQVPITITGENGAVMGSDDNLKLGTSIVRTVPGDIFRVNLDSVGKRVLAANAQYFGFTISGINFNGVVGSTAIKTFRTRGKYIDLTMSNMDYLVEQLPTDASTTPVQNYCDQSSYINIRSFFSKKGILKLYGCDGSKVDGISCEFPSPTCLHMVEASVGSSLYIGEVLYSLNLDTDFPAPAGSSAIMLSSCPGAYVMGMHMENCHFEYLVNSYYSNGVTVNGFYTKFFSNGLFLCENVLGFTFANGFSNGNRGTGFTDIRVIGGYANNEDVVSYNNYFFDGSGTRRVMTRTGNTGKFNDLGPLQQVTNYNFTQGNFVGYAASDAAFAPVFGQPSTVLHTSYDNSADNGFDVGFAVGNIYIKSRDGGVNTPWKILLTRLLADTLYPSLTGGYTNPSWITSLAFTKITTNFTRTLDADYTITTTNESFLLIPIAADRLLTLPAAVFGKSIILYNRNDTAFTWNTSRPIRDNNGLDINFVPNVSVIEIYGDDTGNWRIKNVYKGDNTTWRYTAKTGNTNITPGSRNEVFNCLTTVSLVQTFVLDATTQAGTIKRFKNNGTNTLRVASGTGVVFDGATKNILVLPGEILELTSIAANSWITTSERIKRVINVSNTTDVVTATFLNTNYPIADYDINTIVDYYNQGLMFKRVESALWTFTPTNLLS